MTDSGFDDSSEALARRLEATGEYRVLRRFLPRTHYHEPEGGTLRRALVLDVETTGLDPRSEAIIELALVPFTYVAETGRVVDVGSPVVSLEDPGRPIPAEVTQLTGITQAAVAGQRLDEEAILTAVGDAQLIIAHNAAFDRKFVDKRLPALQGKAWACSHREIPWHRLGRGSRSLEYLLIQHAGIFFEGHRAEHDCLALIHLLALPLATGELPLLLLLESARRRTARIWASGAPFDAKELLKLRGYRWSNGDDGRPRAWFKEVPLEQRDAELEWLKTQVYGGGEAGWKVDLLDARTRYAD